MAGLHYFLCDSKKNLLTKFLYIHTKYNKHYITKPFICRSSFFTTFIDVLLFGTGMIMGASVSTVYYNLKLKHPTLDMPVIDYDLAVLIQPMLMLGISIGVIFNVIFPDWLVTVLLIILFLGAYLVPLPKTMKYLIYCS